MNEKQRAYHREYYWKNRDKKLKQRKSQASSSPERQREYQLHYKERHPEKIAEIRRMASRKWYEANRGMAIKSHKAWAAANAVSVLAYRRDYYAKNKDQINARRKLTRIQKGETVRVSERSRQRFLKQRVMEALGGRCVDCGYSKNPHVLNVHHDGMKLRKQDWKRSDWLDRLPHLVLLCANCHQERHHPH